MRQAMAICGGGRAANKLFPDSTLGSGPRGQSVRYSAAGDVLVDEDGVRPSIMKALTQHNPKVCLMEDDLEALNTLYPDCKTSISIPSASRRLITSAGSASSYGVCAPS